VSKKEFMEELERLLYELPKEEREEALRYYDSYFDEAGTEQEGVVLSELGSAERVAAQILQEYRSENHGGMYTEQGYQTKEPIKQVPVQFFEGKEQEQNKQGSSGIYVTPKKLSGGTLVAVILLAILTFPIWISVLATAFGVLMGLFCASVGITVGFGFGGIGCIIGGVAAFAIGVIKSVTVPVVGAGLIAIGLLVFGVGCLMFAAVGGVLKLLVWAVKGMINLLGRIFHGRKEASV